MLLNLLLRPWIGSCHETRDHMSDFLDDELDERAHTRVRRHLARCSRCRALLESLGRTLERLRSLGAAEHVAHSPATIDAVLQRVEHEAR